MRTCSSWGPRVAVLIGTRIAPSQAHANHASTHLEPVLGHDRDPVAADRRPRPRTHAAVRATASRISANVRLVSPMAGTAGHRTSVACVSRIAGKVRWVDGNSVRHAGSEPRGVTVGLSSGRLELGSA